MPLPVAALEKILAKLGSFPRNILDATVELAVEIAREGREGHRIGTLFTLGDADNVLKKSRPLILDPVALHPAAKRRITDVNLRGTLKELAQLDGAFIIDDEGLVVAGCRYLDTAAEHIEIPFGLGSRHLAAASISKTTRAAAIVVSESAVVRIFHEGVLEAEILPELWLLNRHTLQLRGAPLQQAHDFTVSTQDEPPPNPESR